MKRCLAVSLIVSGLVLIVPARASLQTKPAPNPVLVFETVKGTFEIELFPAEAPKSVEHILGLMKRSVYRGQRFHRVTASLAQFGDPQSRDMSKRDSWGTGTTFSPIGVFELSKKRTHIRGAVGLAHAGNPAAADSQLYIMKVPNPDLNGKHAIIGQVTVGIAVVDKIAVEDLIKNATVK